MPKPVLISAGIVFAITAAIWAYALTRHTFLMREFWLYVGIFTVPGGAVFISLWLMLLRHWAWKLIGTLAMIASLIVWGFTLLLVHVGFKIH